jgi:hypothetical protein
MNTSEQQIIAAMQAPLAYKGASNESDGPQRPSLAAPPFSEDAPVRKNDRVEELGAFGSATGEVGTVLAADEEQAVVKWDGDGRELLRQRYLTRLYDKA